MMEFCCLGLNLGHLSLLSPIRDHHVQQARTCLFVWKAGTADTFAPRVRHRRLTVSGCLILQWAV